jgi:Transglutaminase-like superfamily
MNNPREYYKAQGPMTEVDQDASQTNAMPREIAGLCEVIQGVLIHRYLSQAYGVTFSDERQRDAHVRPAGEILRRIHTIDRRPLTVAREPGGRMVGVCRHFAVMLCGMLREHGIPARARCGFGAYFTPGRFEDHWVCEYWNAGQSRWLLVDAQLDAVQRNIFRPDFDPLDVPRDRFIIAGDAWRMCRAGHADPDLFGLTFVPNLRGYWFIAANVIRDLAALNRMEMLPWDVWGAMPMPGTELGEDAKSLLDRLAALTLGADDAFAEVRAIYDSDERLRVPPVVFNALLNAPETIAS